MKLSEIKKFLKFAKMNFEAVELANGTKISIDGELNKGAKVYIESSDGEKIPMPAGEFELADGMLMIINEAGEIEEIKEMTKEESTEKVIPETAEEMEVVEEITEPTEPADITEAPEGEAIEVVAVNLEDINAKVDTMIMKIQSLLDIFTEYIEMGKGHKAMMEKEVADIKKKIPATNNDVSIKIKTVEKPMTDYEKRKAILMAQMNK